MDALIRPATEHPVQEINTTTDTRDYLAKSIQDAERIIERSKIIKLAIEARKQRFPEEKAFEYKPLSTSTEEFTWNAAAKRSLHDYNLLDLSI